MAEEVRRELVAQFGRQPAYEGGLQVRTSLDPALQAAADNAVRAGLMNYDRKMGGWRGPVTHLSPAGLAQNWPAELAKVAPVPGMLPTWRLGVVLQVSPAEARVGWIELGDASSNRTGVIQRGTEVWHHAMTADGKPGAIYRSMTEMVQPGDVVMIEPGRPGPAGSCCLAPDPEGAGGAGVAWTRRPAGCWRWSAVGASMPASSTGRPRRSVSRAAASSRWSI